VWIITFVTRGELLAFNSEDIDDKISRRSSDFQAIASQRRASGSVPDVFIVEVHGG
jgi:hypothetical protein